jgi:hypothetical protein
VGSVFELGAAGGSLECRNLLTVGHQEIRYLRLYPHHNLCFYFYCADVAFQPMECFTQVVSEAVGRTA